MLEYYLNHPAYAVLLIVLIIITLFVCYKAGKSSYLRGKENDRIIKKLKSENELRNEFSTLSEELIESSDPERLYKGIALNLQKRVADKEDMFLEFSNLSDPQKWVYSLSVFFEDAENGMSNFFKMNTEPLTGTVLRGLDVIIGGKISELYHEEFDAYDDNNQETSLIKSRIEEIDKEAAPIITDGTAHKIIGEYIKDNPSDFLQ